MRIIDPTDPIGSATRASLQLFRSGDQMSDYMRSHLVPQLLLTVQVSVMTTAEGPADVYQREDTGVRRSLVRAPAGRGNYVVMQLPGEDEPEFVI